MQSLRVILPMPEFDLIARKVQWGNTEHYCLDYFVLIKHWIIFELQFQIFDRSFGACD